MEELLKRAVAQIVEKSHLEKRLKAGKPLRVKLGIDPTFPKLHLGHTVVLRKLRQFQAAGHIAVLIIGDYTARIGDPSGRDKTRPALSEQQVKKSAREYERQARKILDSDKLEVFWQSKWYNSFDLQKIIELTAKVSTWHLLSHETFVLRKKRGQSLMHHETLYPLLQGYDSVASRADLELGGVDQTFNLLTARAIQQAYGQKPQDILTVNYLIGTDGSQKMSKTSGNTINLDDEPGEIFGKVMSIPDELIAPYFELVTDLEYKALAKVKQELKTGNPRNAKARLAQLIVEIVYDSAAAENAKEQFEAVFVHGQEPSDMPQFKIKGSSWPIVSLLVKAKLAWSKQQARRLINQAGVKVDGKPVLDENEKIKINKTMTLQAGKRRFARIVKG